MPPRVLAFRTEQPEHRIDIYDTRSFDTLIGPVTAVRVIFDALNHFRPNWIQMNVTDEFAEIKFALTQNRLVPPLKQMADLLVSTIVILRIACEDAMHYPPNHIRLSLDQQMDVIGHHTVGVKKKREPFLLGREQR